MDNPVWGPDWPRVRALWSLDFSRAHLNHGSFGAVPIPVQRSQDELRRQVESNPMKSLLRELPKLLNDAREVAASFLNADMEGFAFVSNATTGVNTVLSSMDFQPGDEVFVTDQAYGAVKFAAERMCTARGAKLVVSRVTLPKENSDELVEAVLSSVSQKTRLAIIEHIASPTGLVFPIEKLVKEIHQRGVAVLVDAAHAPGMVNVDIDALDPDYWTGNFHKWCCAPRGSAGLWAREDHRKLIRPLVTSWYLSEGYPSSFRWLGTDDYTPYLSVPAALDFFKGLGWERVRNHNRILARYGRDVVSAALASEPAVDSKLDGMFEAMTLLQLPGALAKTEEEARMLHNRIAEELAVEASPVAWNGQGYLRLSAQVYNAPEEYRNLAEGLPSLISRMS